MSETIQPALSRPQWKHAVQNSPVPVEDLALTTEEDGSVYVADGGGIVRVPLAARHALAALCLYGQPYGFTQEHVTALESEARMYQNAIGNDTPTARAFRSIAARIAALLPPPTVALPVADS